MSLRSIVKFYIEYKQVHTEQFFYVNLSAMENMLVNTCEKMHGEFVLTHILHKACQLDRELVAQTITSMS